MSVYITTEWNTALNIVIVGSNGCGKSTLLLTFRDSVFPTTVKPGLVTGNWDSDLSIKTLVQGKKCSVFCKDTQNVNYDDTDKRKKKYSNAHVLLCCFSYEDLDSFNEVEKLMKELLAFSWKPCHPPIYIVGLKDDLDNKSLSPTKEMEIEKLIKANRDFSKFPFVSVSCKNNKGVKELYLQITEEALKFAKQCGQVPEDKILNPKDDAAGRKKGACCNVF